MAKTGYLFLAKGYSAREEDIQWMKDFGCDEIIVEEGIQERLRPLWRKTLTLLQPGDEIVITRLSNALRGIREFGAFLDLCREYKVRLVSIHDGIDSKNELFPETKVGDVLDTISRISTEATATRRTQARILRTRKKNKKERTKSALRLDREKTIVNMYKSGHSIDDIWKVSGYKSRTSIFRVLNRNGVELNRISRSSSPAATGTTDNE